MVNPIQRVRRTIWSYAGYAAWIAFTLYKIFNPNTLYPAIWIVLLSLKLVLLIRLIFNRSYFKVAGSLLIICRDFFYKDKIDLNEIERIELKSGPFAKSRIILKDNKKPLKFRYFITMKDDFRKFIETYHITLK